MNRRELLAFAAERFGTQPEYLWARYPDYCVLRHPASGKWYGIVMDVQRCKLGLPGEEHVDALNVKCGAEWSGVWLGTPGILPAWHMRTDAWVTVLLDGTASREDVETLLEQSYALVGPQMRKKRR